MLNVSFYLFLWSPNTHLHTENNTLSKKVEQQETTVATGGVSVTPIMWSRLVFCHMLNKYFVRYPQTVYFFIFTKKIEN